jgi:4,5-DOPA dioxygenase extradiol
MVAPDEKIPGVQFSIRGRPDPARNRTPGNAIIPLRNKRVLVVGSGGAVHPLGNPTVALGEGLPMYACDYFPSSTPP